MAVGSATGGTLDFVKDHNKVELFYHSTSSWQTKHIYPFYESIQGFELITLNNYFILFGGAYKNKQSPGYSASAIIAKFDPNLNQWTKKGTLQAVRHGLGVIEFDKKFLVMGGRGDKRSEICEFGKNETIVCTPREPTMDGFLYYPEMMIVSSDYDKNCRV